MKRAYPFFPVLCIILAMLFALSGCNSSSPAQDDSLDSAGQTDPDEDKGTSESSNQEPADNETSSANEENQVPPEVLYASVLEKYTTALSQGYDRGQLMDAGLNYMCMYHDASEIGYAFLDADQNGTPELLVGPVGSEDCFFDLYTAISGTTILVAQSSERDRYYLCADGAIANESSSGASNSTYAYYTIGEQGQLILSEAVIYDGEYSEDSPWYSTSSISAEGAAPLSWDSAELIFKKHEYVIVDYTAFVPEGSLKSDQTSAPAPTQNSSTGEPSEAAIADALTEIVPPFIAIPGTDTDFTWYDDTHTAGVANVYPKSAQSGAFSISGYITMVMVRSDDGSWFMEVYDNDNCSISYNYAELYKNNAGIQGVDIGSIVEFGEGYAWSTVTPYNYASGGSDPSGESLTCYWDYSDGGHSDAAYMLWDMDDRIVVYFDAQVVPVAFGLND